MQWSPSDLKIIIVSRCDAIFHVFFFLLAQQFNKKYYLNVTSWSVCGWELISKENTATNSCEGSRCGLSEVGNLWIDFEGGCVKNWIIFSKFQYGKQTTRDSSSSVAVRINQVSCPAILLIIAARVAILRHFNWMDFSWVNSAWVRRLNWETCWTPVDYFLFVVAYVMSFVHWMRFIRGKN